MKQGLAALNPIARSYVDEALNTYNSACWKATAVMIGAAAERVVLDLRDALVDKIKLLGKTTPPRPLQSRKAKVILDAIADELKLRQQTMPNKLSEAFAYHWPSFTHQLRAVRNDAGHPSSLDPVTPEAVHASMLTFPELARLAAELTEWVKTNYQ